MYRHLLPCILSVFFPLYLVHSDVLYRCVSCMYRVVHSHVSLLVPGALVCYCIQPVSIHVDVSTFFNTGRYGVEYMCHDVSQCVYQMYRESY